MKPLKPQDGGCWFCDQDECDAFDWEFDTYLHLSCLREALKQPGNSEANCMKYLLEEEK
jgi:hypothetical protein